MNDPGEIRRVLDECRTIAVVGLSSNPMRPSFGVASVMKDVGYHVIPVNPNESEVLGERALGNLDELGETPCLVNIFRRSERAGEAVDDAIRAGVTAVWMQEGVIDHEAAKRASDAGLIVVMDRCWLKEFHKYA